jgi:hypothetical protein
MSRYRTHLTPVRPQTPASVARRVSSNRYLSSEAKYQAGMGYCACSLDDIPNGPRKQSEHERSEKDES